MAHSSFPHEAPSRSTVFDCYSQYCRHLWKMRKVLGGHCRPPTSKHHVTAVRTMLDEDARVTVVHFSGGGYHREVSLPPFRRSFSSARFVLTGYLTNSLGCKGLPGRLGDVQFWLDSMLAAPILCGRWYVEMSAG